MSERLYGDYSLDGWKRYITVARAMRRSEVPITPDELEMFLDRICELEAAMKDIEQNSYDRIDVRIARELR